MADTSDRDFTQALRTEQLIFLFFDDRKPSQAAAVSADARRQIFYVRKRVCR
jgi:hypothetical protein